MNYPIDFIRKPVRPHGISERRWDVFLLSCLALIVSWSFFEAGRKLFISRVSYDTVVDFSSTARSSEPLIASIVASNATGSLVLSKNDRARYLELSNRKFFFIPYTAISRIEQQK
jgi:hypothetical protein